MLNWIKGKVLNSSFNKKHRVFNKYVKKALSIKTDTEFKRHCINCFKQVAKEHQKDFSSISLDDIYRVLTKVRRIAPAVLRKVTVKQLLDIIRGVDRTSHFTSFIYALAGSKISMIYFPIRMLYGKRLKYAIGTWSVTRIAYEIYGDKPRKRLSKTPKYFFHRLFSYK